MVTQFRQVEDKIMISKDKQNWQAEKIKWHGHGGFYCILDTKVRMRYCHLASQQGSLDQK